MLIRVAVATILFAITLIAGPRLARAADSRFADSFALVIGSNAAGDGQQPLAFAETDAKRMARVIQSLGHIPERNIHVLLGPSRAQFDAAVVRISKQLALRSRRGLKSRLFLYYSGHARSDALVLGKQEVPLEQLRARMVALPSTLTIIFLDACQSGAFSRVKGVEPSEDFSFNSVSQLQAEGIAVIASSSATELSQESHRLRSSFFTHHLIVGLRGAGDSDRDGRVTLSEVYRYAYNATLAATTKTRVGGQHPTLETELRGKGEVVLTYPHRSQSKLIFPANLQGKIVVRHASSGNIVAELQHAKEQKSVAFPTGKYTVYVKNDNDFRRCNITLRKNKEMTVDPNQCKLMPLDQKAITKHARKRQE